MKIAVVAHRKKSLGGGLPALRSGLADRGHDEVDWHEVAKSRMAPAVLADVIKRRPDLVIVWGGDGMVQRAVDTLARKKSPEGITMAVMPAGTSNLFASNLEIPEDLEQALDIALGGATKLVDVGVLNGERFATMAGLGMDARMIQDASGALKQRFGRAAYVMTGIKNLGTVAQMTIEVDRAEWYAGPASCVVFGNVGSLIGGIDLFPHADPADGRLDFAVISADGPVQWARLAGRALGGDIARSPFVTIGCGRRINVRADRKLAFELDGGERGETKNLKVRLRRHAVRVRIPHADRSPDQQSGPAVDIQK